MTDYDPVEALCDRIRELLEVLSSQCLEFHPEYPRAQAEVDRAERWREERRLVEAEVR